MYLCALSQLALISFQVVSCNIFFFFFSSRRRHTRSDRDWSSDVCSSDLLGSNTRAWRTGYGHHHTNTNVIVDEKAVGASLCSLASTFSYIQKVRVTC